MSENSQVTVLSPYGAAKLANARLLEEGIAPIPPQMMYNYTTAKLRAGKKPLIAYTVEGGVDRDAFAAWLDRYVAKKTATVEA